MGSGASSNNTTISGYLEKILNEKFKTGTKKIECWNLAQINNYISQDLVNANLFFNKLKPDLVISYAGWNEMATSYLLDQKKFKQFRTYFMEEVGDVGPMSFPSYRNKILKKNIYSFLLQYSKIFAFLNKDNRNSSYFDEKKFIDELKLSSSIFFEHIVKFNLLSKGYKFEYIQFLQPIIYKKKNLTESEKKVVELYNLVRPVHGGVSFGNFLKQNDLYKFIEEEVKNNNNLNCYNLIDMFKDSNEKVFYTLVHMTDFGYRSVAEKIAKVILEKIKK